MVAESQLEDLTASLRKDHNTDGNTIHHRTLRLQNRRALSLEIPRWIQLISRIHALSMVNYILFDLQMVRTHFLGPTNVFPAHWAGRLSYRFYIADQEPALASWKTIRRVSIHTGLPKILTLPLWKDLRAVEWLRKHSGVGYVLWDQDFNALLLRGTADHFILCHQPRWQGEHWTWVVERYPTYPTYRAMKDCSISLPCFSRRPEPDLKPVKLEPSSTSPGLWTPSPVPLHRTFKL